MNPRRERFLRFPGGLAKAVTLSYDDGVIQDRRLASMLKEAGMKCTFNINSGIFTPEDAASTSRRMTLKQCLETYDPQYFEVANHGYNHMTLPALDPATVCWQVSEDRKNLETIFNRRITGMAYPNGPTNEDVIDVLAACGIDYCRITGNTEKMTLPQTEREWLRLPPTCHHRAANLQQLCKTFLEKPVSSNPLWFYLWGHSYEFDDNNNWEIMEGFVETMRDHGDIWYATNGEIFEAWKNFRRLETSADGSAVYNPTCSTVWFANNKGAVYSVAPGETLTYIKEV